MRSFDLGFLRLTEESEPIVIAELGINHGGSLEVAILMAEAAIGAGVRFIKHQTHIPDAEMSIEAQSAIPGNSNQSIYRIISDCTLNEEDEKQLKAYVEERGAVFFSTPFSREAAVRLDAWDVPLFKIGSGECSNFPLVEAISSFGRPVILSTGMNTIPDIKEAYDILANAGCEVALLHTTNLYPTSHSQVRLGGISDLLEAFPHSIVGLSDHSVSNSACLGGVALGAQILERHFTDDKKRVGPDMVCSMDPVEARQLLVGCREIRSASGGKRVPLAEEEVTINFAFASCVALRDMPPGHIIGPGDVWVKRPGNGDFPARSLKQLWGREVVRHVDENTQLGLHHFA